MGMAILKAQAEARQLRKALKVPPVPRTKEGEDAYHLAYCYMSDSAKALEKAHRLMDKQGNRVAAIAINNALVLANQAKTEMYAQYRKRRRR